MKFHGLFYLQDEQTPLHLAADEGSLEVVSLLIKKDAEIAAKDEVSVNMLSIL